MGRSVPAEVAELLGGKASLATEPAGETVGERRDVLAPVHVIPDVLRRRELLEAGRRLDELAQEEVATHLTVGDRVDSDGLLERDRLVHRAVFDFLELSSREPAGSVLLSRLVQKGRA